MLLENLLWQKLKKIMWLYYPNKVVVSDTAQPLWLLFLLNTFVNYAIFPHFGIICSLLFSDIASLVRQPPNSSCDATHQHRNNVNQLK